MARTGDAQGYYYEEGYIDEGYVVYEPYIENDYIEANYFQEETVVTEAEATLTVSTAVTADNTRIKQLSAQFDAAWTSTVTVVASRNDSVDVAIFASFAATADRTRSTDVTLDTIINLSLQADRLRSHSADLLAAASITTTAERTRSFASSPAVSLSLTTTATKINLVLENLNSVFTVNTDTILLKGIGATFNSAFGLQAQTGLILSAQSQINATFSQIAQSGAIRRTAIALDAQFVQNAINTTVFGVDTSLDSNTALNTQINKIQALDADLSSSVSQTIVAARTAGLDADFESVFRALSPIAGTIKQLDADFDSIVSQIVAGGRVAGFLLEPDSAFTQNVTASKIVGVDSDIQNAFTQNVTALRVRTASAVFDVQIIMGTVDNNVNIGVNDGETQVGTVKSTTVDLNFVVTSAFNAVATKNSSAQLDLLFDLAATSSSLIPIASDLSLTTTIGDGQGSIGVNGGIIPNFEQSSFEVVCTMATTSNVIKSASANINSEFALASDGDTLVQAVLSSEFTLDAVAQQTFGRPNVWIEDTNSTLLFSTDSKFGTHSLNSNIKREFTTSTTSSSFEFGPDDFAIEAWVKPNNMQFEATIYDTVYVLDNVSSQYGIALSVTTDLKLRFRQQISGFLPGGNDTSAEFDIATNANTLINNQWNHVALARDGGDTYRLYVNGVLHVNYTHNKLMDYKTSAGDVIIRGERILIDEHRISRFTARYTGSTYTVPTQQFINDTNTSNLLHLDNNLLDDFGAVVLFFNTQFTATVDAGKLQLADSSLNCSTTLAASAQKTAAATVNLIGFASTLTDGEVIPPIQLPATELAASTTLAVDARKFSLKDVIANFTTAIDLLATPTITASANSMLNSQTNLVATAQVVKNVEVELLAQTDLQVVVAQLEIIDSNLQVESTLTATARTDFVLQSTNLTVQTQIQLLFIDTQRYVYTIHSENTTYQIPRETRVFKIDNERRTHTLGEL